MDTDDHDRRAADLFRAILAEGLDFYDVEIQPATATSLAQTIVHDPEYQALSARAALSGMTAEELV